MHKVTLIFNPWSNRQILVCFLIIYAGSSSIVFSTRQRDMKKLIEYFTVDKIYVFAGQKDQVFQMFKNSKGIKYSFEPNDQIELATSISWGTMGFPFGSIRVRMNFQNLDAGRTQVRFKAGIRPEHIFIIVLFLVFITTALESAEPVWHYFLMIGLWIFFHLLFQFIYRIQQMHLIDTVVEGLRLKKL